MIALIAGQGGLPEIVARALAAQDAPFCLCEMEGFPASDRIEGARSRKTFRIERLGSFIADLVSSGVSRVCFAGAVRRPPLDPSLVDAATMPLVPRMMAALEVGDDAALRSVISFFEDAGLAVVGASELVPALLPEANDPPQNAQTGQIQKDAARGAEVVAAMGAIDVGQACAVHRGQALAVEALPGTDAMLRALADQRGGEAGGILFKAPKPGQDRRIDLPAIGPQTVTLAQSAGLAGIVIEAGGVMVLDQKAVETECTRTGLFLWVRRQERA